MKKTTLLLVAFAATFALADSMNNKGKVIQTLETVYSGKAEITCNDTKGWKFDVSAASDDGRDVLTVRLVSEKEAMPPQFGVFFRVPGAGVQNVWTSHMGKDGFHLYPELWWNWDSKYTSHLAGNTPIAVGFNSSEESRVALACSEAFRYVEYGLYANERTSEVTARCEFFLQPSEAMKEYKVRILLDRRGRRWYDTVREMTRWISFENGFKAADVPEAAYDPLYSTWYAYLQDVHADQLEVEAKLAAAAGMKTMILDDGWQKEQSRTFYSKVGDWMPVASRFPDMKAHVAAVHAAGLKYMLWLSVPYVGDESEAYKRFKGKFLRDSDTSVLDPRFPEVREYLISTYERVVGEWGFDGVKLDFIDSFRLPSSDPALKDNYAGRDYRSLPDAVDRLMRDVLARLKKINPDVLVEFRQNYMGPAILQYGNMMRAADCPADPCANRRRVCDLRLTSGKIAVHSDMLVWNKEETAEGAALPILNVLFSTIQYSMVLADVSETHRDVIRHWLKFSQDHREALLKGEFRPHHPENGYSRIEAESGSERIVAVYSPDVCADAGAADKAVYVVNAVDRRGALVECAAAGTAELFTTLGKPAGTVFFEKGVSRLPVPACGYAKLTFGK